MKLKKIVTTLSFLLLLSCRRFRSKKSGLEYDIFVKEAEDMIISTTKDPEEFKV